MFSVWHAAVQFTQQHWAMWCRPMVELGMNSSWLFVLISNGRSYRGDLVDPVSAVLVLHIYDTVLYFYVYWQYSSVCIYISVTVIMTQNFQMVSSLVLTHSWLYSSMAHWTKQTGCFTFPGYYSRTSQICEIIRHIWVPVWRAGDQLEGAAGE